MLKFIIITVLVLYVIYRISGYIFKLAFLASGQRRNAFNNRQHSTEENSKNKEGELHILSTPNKKDRLKGGDYIDFEEVPEK